MRNSLPNQDEGTLNPKGVYPITREEHSITRDDLPIKIEGYSAPITIEGHSITREGYPSTREG